MTTIKFKNKRVELKNSLIKEIYSFFGIGCFFTFQFIRRLGISLFNRKYIILKHLTIEQLKILSFWFSIILIERELLRKIYLRITHFTNIKSYRGMRYKNGYPLKGRTRTNAASAKRILIFYKKKFKSVL